MNEKFRNHPLNGVKLEALLSDLVRHYGWEILADQINIKCFSQYPSFASSVKFLRKTDWARERVEAFYLYKFKQFPLPDEEQHALPPRNRVIGEPPLSDTPAVIEPGGGEFYDDPITGPVFPSKASPASRRAVKSASQSDSHNSNTKRQTKESVTSTEKGATDPWAKWRK